MIILVPAAVSKADVIDLALPSLTAALHKHNSAATQAPRIRLRVAVHAGEVLRSRVGGVGTDLNLACRLVNSQPLYHELTRQPQADMVLAISDVIHQAVVRHGHRGTNPTEYSPVHVVAKEVQTHAWGTHPRHHDNPPTAKTHPATPPSTEVMRGSGSSGQWIY